MSLTINTNLSSKIVQNNLKRSAKGLNVAIERMTTGFKINGAKDNAAGYSIKTQMDTQINSYMVVEDNVTMGLDMLATADDALSLISSHLNRIRDLTMQANNGTYDNYSRKAINSEVNARVDEIERLYASTEYNGIKLFGEEVKTTFIEEVKKRDTTGMTTLESVDENTIISSGTYSISSAEELAKLATMTNNGKVTGGEFVLAGDLDLSKYSNGSGWTPIGMGREAFSATFDGNGYVIRNLYISDKGAKNYSNGLFSQTSNTSVIKNVGLENVSIEVTASTGSHLNRAMGNDGALVGTACGIISNCYATGNIETEGKYAGGLVGLAGGTGAYTATITNCLADVNVKGNSVGGLIGCLHNGDVSDSYATGNVQGKFYAGGLIGCTEAMLGASGYSTITGSYALGNVLSEESAGGLIGQAKRADISSCYAKGSVQGNNNTGGLVGWGISTNIVNSYATGYIKGVNFTGGLLGTLDSGSVNNCFAIGEVSSNVSESSGGLVGYVVTSSIRDEGTEMLTTLSDSLDETTSIGGINPTPVGGGDSTSGSSVITNSFYDINTSGQSDTGKGIGISSIEIKEKMAALDLNDDSIDDKENLVNFQVGIYSNLSSQITLNTAFSISNLSDLRNVGLSNKDYLESIDKLLGIVSSKQTEYGACKNRLESALEEINTHYENLISSRSTLADTDITEESSEYIKNQILQQASATLLSTANQAPALALQLI